MELLHYIGMAIGVAGCSPADDCSTTK